MTLATLMTLKDSLILKGGAASHSYDRATPLWERRREYLGSPKVVNLTYYSRTGVEAVRLKVVTHSLDGIREGPRAERLVPLGRPGRP
jgi:hypothetical protein